MTTPQQPIGSGFGPRSTPADVLAGIDLTGKTAIVTGGYSGLGLATARGLAAAGATVVVPARRPEHAATVLAGIDRVEVAAMDLADQASVRAFAERFLASGRAPDILINNAAVMASPEARVGSHRVRQVARLRPGQDGGRVVRGTPRRARRAARCTGLRGASRRHHDGTPAAPATGGDARARLVRRRRQPRLPLQDPDTAARLWTLSADLTGVDAFAPTGGAE